MSHLDEKTIALFVLNGKEVEGRREEIEAHINDCEGCAELYREMKEHFTEVSDLARTHRQAITLADRVSLEKKEKKRDVVITMRNTPLARFVMYTTEHPAVVGLSFGALIIGAIALLLGRVQFRDDNPSYARSKDEFLVAYNKSGGELWRKHVGPGFSGIPEGLNLAMESGQLLVAKDVDGDKKNEVVAIYGWAMSDSLARQIRCYSSDGSIKWLYEVHKSVKIETRILTDDFRVTRMMVGDFDRDGKTEVIGIGAHIPFSPSLIVKIDGQTGDLLGEYLHHGRLEAAAHTDFDGDGVEELFLGGLNQVYDRAVLVVLDPKAITGTSEVPQSHSIGSTVQSSEWAYILFPKFDIPNDFAQTRSQTTEIVSRSDGLLQVGVTEGYDKADRPIGVSFYFDKNLRCVTASSSDAMESLFKALVSEGRIKAIPDSNYFRKLCSEVDYWDGVGFVKTPVQGGKKVSISAK